MSTSERVLRLSRDEVEELVLKEAARRGFKNPKWHQAEYEFTDSFAGSLAVFDGYSVGE